MTSCAQRHPAMLGALCTRDEGHAGGHLDKLLDVYWQDKSPAPDSSVDVVARRQRQADRRQRLAGSLGGAA